MKTINNFRILSLFLVLSCALNGMVKKDCRAAIAGGASPLGYVGIGLMVAGGVTDFGSILYFKDHDKFPVLFFLIGGTLTFASGIVLGETSDEVSFGSLAESALDFSEDETAVWNTEKDLFASIVNTSSERWGEFKSLTEKQRLTVAIEMREAMTENLSNEMNSVISKLSSNVVSNAR